MSNKGKKIQDLPPPTKPWPKPEPHQVLAAPAAAATPRGYGEGIRRTQGERGQPGPSQPGGQLHPTPKSKQALKNRRKRYEQQQRKKQEKKEQRAEGAARRLEGVKRRVARKHGGVPQLPVPRASHVRRQQEKVGFKEEYEFMEVDNNGKELFRKIPKQALPKGFPC